MRLKPSRRQVGAFDGRPTAAEKKRLRLRMRAAERERSVDAAVGLQVEGHDLMLKGMSQQDAKGWQQALATACMLQ